MASELRQEQLDQLLPADSPWAQHCKRVSALALEIASRTSLPRRSRGILEQAALLHHAWEVLLQPRVPGQTQEPIALPTELDAVLREFNGILPREPDRQTRLLAEILTVSNSLDEQLETLSVEPKPVSAIWGDLQELRGLFHAEVLTAAHTALAVPFQGTGYCGWGLPVQAIVAKDVLRMLAGKAECELPQLAELASRDPVMAGSLIQSANSALYGRRNPARTVPDAISYIGLDATRKLLMALAIRPLFASAKLLDLWQHSIWMAQFCEGLARTTGLMEPEEALLIGLVHDIGRIALQNQHREGLNTYARLAQKGCPAVYIERLLFGRDHSEIGAAVLQSWQFPEDLVEAVQFHHRPADTESPGAAALYAAEYWAATDEDLGSIRHLSVAFANAGCSRDILAAAGAFKSPLAGLLKVA